jgi:hypothetical protein
MSCCGQKRDGFAAEAGRLTNLATHGVAHPRTVDPGTPGARPASPPAERNLTVTLRYRSRSALIVLGSKTGKRYQFSAGGSMQAVDRRDAEFLVASGLFERVEG